MIMKIALLFALYISAASASTCGILACASGLGNTCGVTKTGSPATDTVCTGTNQFCNITGNSNTGVCTSLLSLGATCSNGNGGNLCASKYCNQASVCANNDLSNGQKCSYNADCASYNCVNNVCTGVGLGGSCSNSANCNLNGADNLYCNAGTCATVTGINAACTSSSVCADGLYCSSTQNKCVPYYSLGSGAACTDDTVSTYGDTDSQCGDGLTCVSGKCAAAPSSSNTKCSSDNDCTAANEACTCNYNTGSGTCQTLYTVKVSGATAVANGISSCYTGACSGDQGSACLQSKCKSVYCTGAHYVVNTENTGSQNVPACFAAYAGATLPSTCNGASSVAISAFVVFAALAALMM